MFEWTILKKYSWFFQLVIKPDPNLSDLSWGIFEISFSKKNIFGFRFDRLSEEAEWLGGQIEKSIVSMKNKASASGTAAHAIHDEGARRSSRQRIDLSRADEG